MCYLLSIAIPSISDAMTLVGSTTNPAVGFILPIIFYWRSLDVKKVPKCKGERILAIFVAIFIIAISCLSLYAWFNKILS